MVKEQTPAHNTMHVLADGIIELIQTGYQTPASTTEFAPQIDKMIRTNRENHKLSLVMADISGITGHDVKVREMAHDMLQSDFDAMAIVTSQNITARLIGNWLVRLVGVGQRVQFFEDRDEALAWLRTHKTS